MIDGKTVRNSGAGDPQANVKLFSAMLHDQAVVTAQIQVRTAPRYQGFEFLRGWQ